MFDSKVVWRQGDASVPPRRVRIPTPGRIAASIALSVGLCSVACPTSAAEDPPTVANPAVADASEVPVGVLRLEEAPPPELPEPAPPSETDDGQPVRPRRSLRSPVSAGDFTHVETVVNDDGTIRRVATLFGKPIDGQSLEPRRDPPDAPPRAKLSARSADDDAPVATPAAAPGDDGRGWLGAGALGACLVLGIVVLVLRK
jgi:hypothetical protein